MRGIKNLAGVLGRGRLGGGRLVARGRRGSGRRGGGLKALPDEAAEALKNWHRQALHAYRLAFRHPLNGDQMEFASAPPSDMQALLDAGRQ